MAAVGASLYCTFFVFPYALPRLLESVRDLGTSIGLFFCIFFEIPNDIIAGVVQKSGSGLSIVFPESLKEFIENSDRFFGLIISPDNFEGYLSETGRNLNGILKLSIILIPMVIAVTIIVKRGIETVNTDHNRDSRFLSVWRRFSSRVISPAEKKIIGMANEIRERKIYLKLLAFIWLINLNFLVIVTEALAYYFYFVTTFDLSSVFVQIYKLAADLSVSVTFIPGVVWIIGGYLLFCYVRKERALKKLDRNERHNREIIDKLPIVTMVCGTMGKRKTTLITDMALSQEVIFRDKAFEKLLETDMTFPEFPWISLETSVRRAMERHEIYNLLTCRKWVEKREASFNRRKTRNKLFGYDYRTKKMDHNDGLKITSVWDALKTYVQLYFIYVMESSLIVSNYSIRDDVRLSDMGNLPIWQNDFFDGKPELREAYSRHSHILDFDFLRLGETVLENNPRKDMFEFGVVVITEIGKERGNQLELREIKKASFEANQKNDLFNSWLKMCRHSATVDNYPFVKVFVDEQRPESWGADARDLCDIVNIDEIGNFESSLTMTSAEDLIYALMFPRFFEFYAKFRYYHGNNTLAMYLLKRICGKTYNFFGRLDNVYGYTPVTLSVQNGTMAGRKTDYRYFLNHGKIYADRFSTDCYSDFFASKVSFSEMGLADLEEYGATRASVDELKKQNSYFVRDISSMEDKR